MPDTHAATTTLDDIINELKLTYDPSVGLLDGDSVRNMPNVNILTNLNKLFQNLRKQLSEVEAVDETVLSKINAIKSGNRKGDLTKDNNRKRTIADVNKRTVQENGLETLPSDNESGIENLVKRRKPNIVEVKTERHEGEEDGEGNASREEKNDNKDKYMDEKNSNNDNANTSFDNYNGSDKKVRQHKLEATREEGDMDPENENKKELVNSKDDPVPPVQSGSFTSDNDTRLKNPKSEYVEPQTLSAEAIADLGLYSEDNDGLETHGTEYLKRKYGVASYPENDLLDLLPGSIPNIDFSKNKPPTNQVQFTTFQSYIESYFRPFNNDDLTFLKERNIIPPGFEKLGYDPDLSPFIIPKLGKFYADVWTEEDATLAAKLTSTAHYQTGPESYKAKGSLEELNDESLYTENISCGPLSNRLLSAILSTHEAQASMIDDENNNNNNNNNNSNTNNNNNNDDDDGIKDGDQSVSAKGITNYNKKDKEGTNGKRLVEVKEEKGGTGSSNILLEDEVATQLNSTEDYRLATEPSDYHTIEERLKRELKYIGIFMNLPSIDDSTKSKPKVQASGRAPKRSTQTSIIDNDDWIKNREDDEVCAEIRTLQRELREVTSRNRANKKKLLPMVEEHIAYQEYCTILEELDKQVDQAYMKRSKGRGKKKKIDTTTPQQQAVNSGLRALLVKRRRWIDNIGVLFPPAEIMKRVPGETIMIKEGEVEAESIEDQEPENGPLAAVSKLI